MISIGDLKGQPLGFGREKTIKDVQKLNNRVNQWDLIDTHRAFREIPAERHYYRLPTRHSSRHSIKQIQRNLKELESHSICV